MISDKMINHIDIETDNLIEDNYNLINAFKERLANRLVLIFKKHGVPFNITIIEKLINENFINNLTDVCTENSNIIRKAIIKYNGIMKEYTTNNYNKGVLKKATSMFINKLFTANHPMLNTSISTNFLEAINAKTAIYDNYELNVEVKKKIIDDTNSFLVEINLNNKKYIIDNMKYVIKCINSNIE